MYLVHSGRLGQKWGVTNGPPYPLDIPRKEYNVGKKVKQFMYDRFSEYGKDHRAVRDRLIEQYKKRGYNETASQILAENKYQQQDKAFLKAVAIGMFLTGAVPIGVSLLSKEIIAIGGYKVLRNKLVNAMSQSFVKAVSDAGAVEIGKKFVEGAISSSALRSVGLGGGVR